LFSYDIWKRWHPATPDPKLVIVGRATTVVATIVAIVLSPIFGHYGTIFQGLTTLICYVAPPITAVFLVGVFCPRANGRAAFLTMVVGAGIGAVCFTADFFKEAISGPKGFLAPNSAAASVFDWFVRNLLSDFMLASFGIFCLCVLIQVIASLVMPEPLKEEARPLVWEHWTEPLKAKCGTGLSDYRLMSAAVLATFIVLYLIFR